MAGHAARVQAAVADAAAAAVMIIPATRASQGSHGGRSNWIERYSAKNVQCERKRSGQKIDRDERCGLQRVWGAVRDQSRTRFPGRCSGRPAGRLAA